MPDNFRPFTTFYIPYIPICIFYVDLVNYITPKKYMKLFRSTSYNQMLLKIGDIFNYFHCQMSSDIQIFIERRSILSLPKK